MIKIDFDKKYLFSICNIDKKSRSFYLNQYKSFKEEDRIKTHFLKFKIFLKNKHLFIKDNQGEFYYACFLMAIKHIHLDSINIDSIILDDNSINGILNKKNTFEINYKSMVLEMRDLGMSWRKISDHLNNKYGFKIHFTNIRKYVQ